VLGSLGWLFNFVRQSFSARAVGDVVLKLREDAFDAVMKRDMSFYDTFASGKIVSRVTSDTNDFSNTITLVLSMAREFLLVFVVMVVLFLRSVELALLVLAMVPVIVAVALGFRRVARNVTQQSQRAQGEINGMISETMRGISVAKSYRQEATIYREFEDISDRTYRVRLKQGFIFSGIFPLLFGIAGLGTTALVWIGGDRVVSGDISAGDWYLFIQAVGTFWFPLTSIASFWSQFQQGLSASERVFALIDAEPRVVQTGAEAVGRLAQCRKWRSPVKTMATPSSSARAMVSSSFTLPPGWITAAAPASMKCRRLRFRWTSRSRRTASASASLSASARL
jgi:ABC-type multidrug transport system fused ATPase/permease subunit